MTAPSLTLKSLQNKETGIDISVPCFQEEEAPLGGVSVLYEVSVLTKLEQFKTRLHTNEDVVQFSVYKAYREIEDLYNKLKKKYPDVCLPVVPKATVIGNYTNAENVASLDQFMQTISKNSDLCKSSAFTHFIGISSPRLSTTIPDSTQSSDITTKKQRNEFEKVKTFDDLSNVFPKVKNTVTKVENKSFQTTSATSENVDLFEEVTLVKGVDTKGISKERNTGGLFDDFEDENLFNTQPTPKPSSPMKQVQNVPEVKSKKKDLVKKPETTSVDDSQIIIKDRKFGNISLFDQQDLGDYITQEEESLFLVVSDNKDKNKKNSLLSDNSETIQVDPELNENLDDLLDLNPLPTSPASKNTESFNSSEVKSKCKTTSENRIIGHQPKKPVPLPRKKSLGKSDTDELSMTKPEVMPRKVFLTKPEVPSKPVVSSTNQDVPKSFKLPSAGMKPVPPPKPKPPPKAPKPTLHKESKDLDALNANKPIKGQNQNSEANLTDDFKKLDILKYIEQEQKILETEPSLFD